MQITDLSYSPVNVGILMVFVILNLSELKFSLYGLNVIEKLFPLRLFFKNKNMFLKRDTHCRTVYKY